MRAIVLKSSGCSDILVVRAVVQSDVRIALNEVCAVVVLNKNSVQMFGFINQTVV